MSPLLFLEIRCLTLLHVTDIRLSLPPPSSPPPPWSEGTTLAGVVATPYKFNIIYGIFFDVYISIKITACVEVVMCSLNSMFLLLRSEDYIACLY